MQTATTAPGLTDAAVIAARAAHGRNVLPDANSSGLLATLREVVLEPMFLLLLAACAVYFALQRSEEAITLIAALLVVAGISVYQSVRSNQALSVLRELTQPRAQVRRNGALATVPVEALVMGDAVLVAEGNRLPADGTVTEPNDFLVDEAILTGEAVPVAKAVGDAVFGGSSTASGSAWLTLTAVGGQTKLGLIGHSMERIITEKTPLQVQVRQFVLRMAWVGAGAFALVRGVNYAKSGDWVTALLFGLTLAMSILSEEIPVAFSSFMALGAARLSRLGVLTKQPQTVESLGAATVICADKTGTLTQEGMRVAQLYDGSTANLVALPGLLAPTAASVLACARWAFETEPFEAGQMQQPPRPLGSTFLAGAELGRGVAQGLGIAAAVLGVYYAAMQQSLPLPVSRMLVFATLVLSNIILTLVNRSFTQAVWRTLRVPNRVLWLMLALTLVLLLATLLMPAAQRLFGFAPVPLAQLGGCGLAALVGAGWVEIYKAVRH